MTERDVAWVAFVRRVTQELAAGTGHYLLLLEACPTEIDLTRAIVRGVRTLFAEDFPDGQDHLDDEGRAAISPDGRWIAYTSDESGKFEVYVRPFPSGPGRWLISNGSGLWPIWSRTSNVLYFATIEGRMNAVTYEAHGAAFVPGRPATVPGMQLVSRGALYSWALHPDGRRFLGAVPDPSAQAGQQQVILVSGFVDDLKARAK